VAEVSRLRAEVAELRSQTDVSGRAIDLLLGSRGRRSSRLIAPDALHALAEQVRMVSGVPDSHGRLVQACRTLVELELRGLDRFAGPTANVLGKLATVLALDPPTGEILELGTRSGTFAAGAVRQLSRAGIEYRLTVLDPFHDPGQQDTARVVTREHLLLSGVDPGRTRLIRGDAADQQARALVQDRRYGVIVVDGDHRAPAVALDLDLAEQVAAPGAVVLVDDYADRNWPQVREATQRHLAGSTRFEQVGVVGSCIFLRAVRTLTGTAHSPAHPGRVQLPRPAHDRAVARP